MKVAAGGRYDAIRTLVAQLYNRHGKDEAFIWANVRDVLAPRFAVPLTEPELRDRFERTWRDVEKNLGEPKLTPEAVQARTTAIAPSKYEDRVLEELPTGAFPEEPDPIAFIGCAGESVANLEAVTTASRVGLLASILSIAGTVLGIKTEYHGEQPSSFMPCLVGETGRGRKTTAMTAAWRALTGANAFGDQDHVNVAGVGSGEGLVAITAKRAERLGYARILFTADELGEVLTINKREGTTLSFTLRKAFDGQKLANITKTTQIEVAGRYYQMGLLAGITPGDLRDLLELGRPGQRLR